MGEKLVQAERLMKEAQSCLQRTLFRWKPDWDGAIACFEQAATLFKSANQPERSKEAHIACADAKVKVDNMFAAGKNLESAAYIASQMKQLDEAMILYERAAHLFRTGGHPDKSGDIRMRAARLIEPTNPHKACELMLGACDIYEEEEREQFAADTFKYAQLILLKAARFSDAVGIMRRLLRVYSKLGHPQSMHKMYLSIIIVQLHMGDPEGAEQSYRHFQETDAEWSRTDEFQATTQLMDAFDKQNEELLREVTSKQVFGFLDNQIATIAKRHLSITDSGPPGVTVIPSMEYHDDEDDDEEGEQEEGGAGGGGGEEGEDDDFL